MNYPSIRIEGAILSPDILGQLEDLPGQKPADFGLDSGTKVKDEIARAWADAQDYWRIFQRKLESLKPGSNATTETRNLWMVPLLGLLRYDLEYQPRGSELNGRIYAISHRVTNRAGAAVQIVGYRDPAGLDKKPANAARRMSSHAMVQEFLNLDEQLYGLVADGHVLRLLRDSSRLVKLSYLEFDLDRIFSDGLYADFAVLYRLLHATRLPLTNDSAAESLIERYHQDSLDSGARIRAGLSKAVERAILDFGNGFVAHAENENLRTSISDGALSADAFYQQLLRLIYRLLFLMVIEERGLVFPSDVPRAQREVYRNYYSIARLRRLSEKKYLADPRRNDLWQGLKASFSLFEAAGRGQELGIAPLAGDLFSREAVNALEECALGNDVLLGGLRALGLYRHPDTGQIIRVNYAALNVEEFGSVYEGLLEYEPEFISEGVDVRFAFRQGDARAATGSHYTPDELVQPLIRHSLDYLIAERLKAGDPQAALLGLRVADIACGSGHILLAAARRIATELAAVRTGEEQPSPSAYRTALRDVIRTCIYGVDLNPLAVELCKVALWLEAHIPGQPLNFLDHHIKCGNAIVGFAGREQVLRGVPIEAFKTLADDDKEVAATFRTRYKAELKHHKQTSVDFTMQLRGNMDTVIREWHELSSLPEDSLAAIEVKKARFRAFEHGDSMCALRAITDVPVAQFYHHKTQANVTVLTTNGDFESWMRGETSPREASVQAAQLMSERMHFFHWFLEFPEIMESGGFDCILGNPPYLGDKALSGTYGHRFCECMKWLYSPCGLTDLVVYFLRRIHALLKNNGFTAIITTNSIVDGDVRKAGLDQLIAAGSEINMAVRGKKWPGAANLVVSLLSVHKGKWDGARILDERPVEWINSFFEVDEDLSEPQCISENAAKVFTGYYWLGDGFLLSHTRAAELVAEDSSNAEVIFATINGKEVNDSPEQAPGRSIINFRDWPIEKARQYAAAFSIVRDLVEPYRAERNRQRNRDFWWIYGEYRPGLSRAVEPLVSCFASARTTKHLCFSRLPADYVFSDALNVLTTDRWDLFTVVQSTIHEVWARKYSGSLETRLRYSPSDCFDTYAFPSGLWLAPDPELADIGERYHEHRKALMQSLWLGLTKIYNLFHASDLSPEMVAKVAKKDSRVAAEGHDALLQLRRLHVEMDIAVRDAYGWQDLNLEHGFHDVEALPEDDRIRFTISPSSRREILRRLLAENHRRASEESTTPSPIFGTKRGRAKFPAEAGGGSLFPEEN